MTIIALLIGLVAGAAGVLFLLRPALAERRARGERVLELERELAGATARLGASERSFAPGGGFAAFCRFARSV